MKNKILITLPKLTTSGGVSSYWNALLPKLQAYDDLNISTLEIGGHGKNIFGTIIDQWNFKKIINKDIALAFLNPSLGSRSFYRDGLFAKQLIQRKVPFVVFFHGWDLNFERKVNKRYIKFFINSFGKAKKIFVLSSDFKRKIIEWGYIGEVILETTNVESSLIDDFSIKNKINDLKSTEKIKLLFLARLIRQKGVFETVNAFRSLSKKYHNIELTIAGDGEDLKDIRNYVKNDLKINVKGRVEGNKKITIFKGSHIYCFPTFYGEGLPTSILEAMAFGMPVITTNMGGLKEFFQNGKMGYLVEPKNVKEIEEKLELLLLNRDKMIRIGEYNYNYASENLINSVVAKRIYGHMLDVMNKN